MIVRLTPLRSPNSWRASNDTSSGRCGRAFALAAPAVALPLKIKDKRPNVEVVFCLDTTGSMGGLIEGAKQKIWSISNQIVGGKPTPNLKVGLVAYRDRGDAYVTKVFDLTDDLDAIYSNLKEFKAEGGGDTPESVNQALHESRHEVQVVRRQGDAADHLPRRRRSAAHGLHRRREVPRDVQAGRSQKGIIINTVQCGNDAECAKYLAGHRDQGGRVIRADRPGRSDVRVITPYDKRLAEINAELENSTLVYGSKEKQQKDQESRLKALDGAKADPAKPGDPKGAAPVVKVEPPKAPDAKPGTVVPTTGIGGFGGGAPGFRVVHLAAASQPAPWPPIGRRSTPCADSSTTGTCSAISRAARSSSTISRTRSCPKNFANCRKRNGRRFSTTSRRIATNFARRLAIWPKKRDDYTKKKLEEEGKKGKEGFDQKVEELLRKQAKKAGIDY